MLRFTRRASHGFPRKVAVLPGSYNPPTIAHLALARHAAALADEVLLVLPERLPHKGFGDASHPQRMHLLQILAEAEDLSVGTTPGGLYLEIAHLCRTAYPGAEIALVCGKDAAERIVAWPYAEADALERLFAAADLWVYAREGSFTAPPVFHDRIQCFDFDEALQRLSASEVRRRIRAAEEWRSLVPEQIHAQVERIYSAGGVPPCED